MVPGVTVTSSQPSRPKLSRIAWVLWISTGAVGYSHVVPGAAGELMADNCSRRLIALGEPVASPS